MKENVNETINNGRKHLSLLPLIIGTAYFIGFIIINSYLSEFDFIHDNLLSVNYLSAGFSFIIFSLPIIIIIYSVYDNPTDDASKNKGEFWFIIGIVLFYSLIIDFFTYDRENIPLWKDMLMKGFLFFYSFMIFYLRSYAARNLSFRKTLFFMITPLIVYHILSLFLLPIILELKFLLILIGIGTLIILGQMGDKIYSIGQGAFLMILVVVFSSFFGYTIYGKLPTKFGGANRVEVRCFLNEGNINPLNYLNIKLDSLNSFSCQIYYSTDEQYLIRKGDIMFTLDHNDIKSFVKLNHRKTKAKRIRVKIGQ